MKVAVIGSGISGLTSAAVFQDEGHEVSVYERGERVGGVWAHTYPEVRLQNIRGQYELSDLPWTGPADLNPSADQIRAYLDEVVRALRPRLRLGHEVTRLLPVEGGWRVQGRGPEGDFDDEVEHVVLAVGQFTQPKAALPWPGRERYRGALLTERELTDLGALAGKTVAVVGFGKTALDLSALAAARGARVTQVFRAARWMIPHHFAGRVHYTRILFARFGSVMIPCWDHPTAAERLLHAAGGLIRGFWWGVERLFLMELRAAARGRDAAARARIEAITPRHPLLKDMRSAAPMVPEGYVEAVAEGRITPRQGEVQGFTERGLRLADGGEVQAEVVLLALGAGSPTFPYLPDALRAHLEGEPDGVQLYRHLLHPRVPNLSFSGYNHSFLHIPCAEVGARWVCATLRGDLTLPSVEAMEAEMARVRDWKRAHIHHEPSLLCAVNTRYQQHLDMLMQDLGLSPYRKLPNLPAEVFGRYGPADYRGLGAALREARARSPRAVSARAV